MLIPSLTGKPPPNDSIRVLLAVLAKLGGLGLLNPVTMAGVDYSSSHKVSGPLLGQILQQAPIYSMKVVYQQILLKQDVVADRRRLDMDAVSSMRESLPEDLQRSMNLASDKGASVLWT